MNRTQSLGPLRTDSNPAALPPLHRESAPTPPARLVSLDAFRGAIMLLMASAGLELTKISRAFPESGVWRAVGFHCDHVAWNGCALWDLIQPAFMFMVGTALPWSVASRQAKGVPFGRMFGHAVWRAGMLVVLALVVTSAYGKQTDWSFPNVLAQIGLGYPFLFLLAFTGPRTPWLVAGGVLLGYWAAFALHPLPPPGFDWTSVGVPADWPFHFQGFSAHWEKNFNLAATFDRWFLNLFPRPTPFVFNKGGYQTLNFIPSLATMTFGLLAGRLLRSELPMPGKIMRLVVTGLAGIALGLAIDRAGFCPLVKRIWTPSWALFSAGWVSLMLAAFVAVIDWRGWQRWAFPFVVVGLNPITLYLMFQLSSGFIRQELRIHFGQEIFASFGELWAPALERGSVLVILWLVVWCMYRRKIFLRV